MCGIFGIVDFKGDIPREKKVLYLRALATFNEERGKDASGIGMYMPDGKRIIVKDTVLGHKLPWEEASDALVVLGHTRAATCGSRASDGAHPFAFNGHMMTHNGTGSADHERLKWAQGESKVDSETMLRYLVTKGGATKDGIEQFAKEWKASSYSIQVIKPDGTFIAFRESNPFHFLRLPQGGIIYTSTQAALTVFARIFGFPEGELFYTEEDSFLAISKETHEIVKLNKPKTVSYQPGTYWAGGNYHASR